jgi:hypothetical protein
MGNLSQGKSGEYSVGRNRVSFSVGMRGRFGSNVPGSSYPVPDLFDTWSFYRGQFDVIPANATSQLEAAVLSKA